MLKIHLIKDTETLIIIAMSFLLIVLTVVNIFVLIPSVSDILSPSKPIDSRQLINTSNVNQAIEYLNK